MMVLLSDMDNSTFLWSIFRYPFTALTNSFHAFGVDLLTYAPDNSIQRQNERDCCIISTVLDSPGFRKAYITFANVTSLLFRNLKICSII